jgi:hypothetical protein
MAGQFRSIMRALVTWVGKPIGRSVMRKQVLAAAAILCFIGGTSGPYAADKSQMPSNGILTIAEQVLQGPVLGPPRGKLTPATPEALQRELPDDRFISDVFPPIRLIFPDGTKEPEPKGRYELARVLKVQPLTGEHVLKAFAKDVPFDPDAKSAAAVDDTPLVDSQLLFDQRRVKEWSK